MTNRLEQLLKLQKDLPGDSFICFALAKEYEMLQMPNEAMAHYLRLKDNDPSYVGLYYHLGKLYEALGKTQEAYDTYTQGMKVALAQGDKHSHSELEGARSFL